MALNRVDLGIQYFPQFAADRAIANAQIYIGQPDLDPSIPANQYQAYVMQENGVEVAVSQPIRTGAGGVPTFNGSPVVIKIQENDYSVKVLSSTGSQIYYKPNNQGIVTDSQRLTFIAGVDYTKNISTSLNLTGSPINETSIMPFFEDLYQDSTTWTFVAPTITFDAPISSDRVEILYETSRTFEELDQAVIDAQAAAAAADIDAAAAAASALSAAGSANSAATSASNALTSANNAQTSAANAQAAAEASGDVRFYPTKAAANAAAGSLPEGQVVEVFIDESQGGFRTRYIKESGVLEYKLNLSVPRTFYVDQVNGLDTNEGLIRTAPFKTIARLTQETIGPGTTIRLARGSIWREQLVVNNGVTVEAYNGTGALPTLDGADILPNANFSLDGGNTYLVQVTRPGYSPRVYENGTLLTRRTSKALVDANPGSFTVITSGVVRNRDFFSVPSVTWEVYVHPLGSTNPIVDGKTYETPMREYGLYMGDECSAINIQTKRQWSPNGSLILNNTGYISGCIATDGAKHNMWITSGVCEDSTCIRNEGGTLTGDSTLFVSFSGNQYQLEVTYRRCKAINGFAVAYFSHTDGGGNYKRVAFEDCDIINTGGGYVSNECDQLIVERGKIFDSVSAGPSLAPAAGTLSAVFIDCEAYYFNNISFVLNTPPAGRTREIRGGKFYMASGTFLRVDNSGSLKVEGAQICFDQTRGLGSANNVFTNVGNPAATIDFNYNTIQDGGNYLFGTGATVNMDYNVGSISTGPLGTSNAHGFSILTPFLPGDPRNGDWTMRTDIPKAGVQINAITHTGGGVGGQRCFMAVGDDGLVRTYDTAVYSVPSFWRQNLVPSPSVNNLYGATWLSRGPNSFIVVGSVGGIYQGTGNPGSTLAWTTITPPVGLENAVFRDVADDGTANTVAVGDGGVIIRSTDGGVTWAQVASGTTDALYSVAFNGLTGIAVGLNGRVCRSTDGGATWAATTAGSRTYYSSTFADSKWVIAGDNGMLRTSVDDGVTFTQRYTATFSRIRSVAYGLDNFGSGKKTWVAVMERQNAAGGLIMRTDDPTTTWEEVDSPITTDWYGVASKTQEDSVFMIVGKGDLTIASTRGGGFQIYQVATQRTRFGDTPSNWLANSLTELEELTG